MAREFLDKVFLCIKKKQKARILDLINHLCPYDVGIDLIRLGSNNDGGYLVPDDLEGIDACFSPGVSTMSEFEKDCSKRGMKLFLADKSIDKVNLPPNIKHEFLKKFIACTDNEDYITMDTWVKERVDTKSDLLLQMDIEKGEYVSFINMSHSLINRFRIIVVEFHDLHKLWHNTFYNTAHKVFMKILQTHTCIHIHPNNCKPLYSKGRIEIPRIAEFTFIRNDRIKKKGTMEKFTPPFR